MPFNTTTTVPRLDSMVTVKFAGLMLLKPGPNNTCEVGVHRLSAYHTFQAMLVVNRPRLPLTLVHLFTGPLTAPFTIDVRPAPSDGFKVFAKEPFARNNPASHDSDYRWALNLRSLHPTADFNQDALPGVTLNSGILYTANPTRPGMNPELVPSPQSGKPRQPLHKFAADLAVAIDAPPNGGVIIGWEEAGRQQRRQLPRDADRLHPGTTYTISLINDPQMSNPPAHDELSLYYQVLRDGGNPIPDDDRYTIETDQGQSDEIPCMPILLHP